MVEFEERGQITQLNDVNFFCFFVYFTVWICIIIKKNNIKIGII